MSRTRGAVLDFDGVLVRSMELHAEAYRRVLAPFGIPVADETVFRMEGARSETILREILEEAGKPLPAPDLERLANDKQEVFRSLGPPEPYRGASAMVDAIRRAAPKLAVVTGTRRENVPRLMPRLVERLDALLAQDAYTHDKPHPEPYQKAAQALELDPRDCVALENAVRGVASAKAAGYGRVVAITTTMPQAALDEAGADEVVLDHKAAAEAVVMWFG